MYYVINIGIVLVNKCLNALFYIYKYFKYILYANFISYIFYI